MSNVIDKTPYEQLGAEQGVRHLVERFYDLIEQDSQFCELRAMHPADLSGMRQKLFEFMSGWLGGPPLYFEQPGHACIVSAHRPFAIGATERDQWLAAMYRALGETSLNERTRELLRQALHRVAEAFRNR